MPSQNTPLSICCQRLARQPTVTDQWGWSTRSCHLKLVSQLLSKLSFIYWSKIAGTYLMWCLNIFHHIPIPQHISTYFSCIFSGSKIFPIHFPCMFSHHIRLTSNRLAIGPACTGTRWSPWKHRSSSAATPRMPRYRNCMVNQRGKGKGTHLWYPPGNIQKAIENGHRNSWFIHLKLWFSIVMLVYQRVFMCIWITERNQHFFFFRKSKVGSKLGMFKFIEHYLHIYVDVYIYICMCVYI